MDSKQRLYLEAEINDAIRQCRNKNTLKFVGFLDATGAATAVSAATKDKAKFMLYGGYSEAERVYFGVFPEWCEPDASHFPIVRLKICNKSRNPLSHRDVLGAFMSAGIERDKVGDILINGTDPVAFVSDSIAGHIMAHIQKIASSGVEIVRDESTEVPITARFQEMSGTVASLRLDCVVAELANCSRGKAAELIEGGFVAVGGLEVLKLTAEVKANDVISVRRVGKFVIDECDRLTKKGRVALLYRKYI